MVARMAIGLVALAFAAPAAHAQSWSPPVTLSTQPAGATSPAVAVGADGTAAVVWTEEAGVDKPSKAFVAIRPAGDAFGAPVQLTALGNERGRPAVAVGPTGTVLAVWVDDADPDAVSDEWVRAVTWTASGGFGAVHLLAYGNRLEEAPAAAFDANGVATVAWADDDTAYTARRQPGGAWTATEALAPKDSTSIQWVKLAVAANGDAALSWDGMIAVREGPQAAFGTGEPFAGSRDHKIAIGPDGRAVAYWRDGEQTLAADRGPDGGFGTPYELIDRGYGTGVAIAPDGRAHAVCMCSQGGEHDLVQRRERPAGGTWGAPVLVAAPAEHGGASGERGPLAVTDAAGSLFYAWHGTEFQTLVDTVIANAAGGPAPVPSLRSVAHSPALAAGPAGVAVLAWITAAGVQASWWTGAPPTEPPPPPPPVDAPAFDHTPAFQGGPARAGRIAGASVGTPLELAWTEDTGRASQGALLAGGRVFLRGGGDERPVLAYDLRSGAQRWRAPVTRYAVYDHLAYADGKVFVAGHETLALDAATGAQAWHSPASGEWPVVDGGRLLMGSGVSTVALGAADGAPLWEAPTGDQDGAVSTGLGRAFRAGRDSAVAFELASGARAWLQSGGSSGHQAAPAAFDGAWMWVADSHIGRAYDLRTGLVATLFPPGGLVALSAPLGYQVRERALVAFDLRTLAVRWELPLAYDARQGASPPLVVDELVFLAAGGKLHAVDRLTGTLRWSAPLTAAQSGGGLAAGEGHVVVPTVVGADVFRAAGTPSGGTPPADGGAAGGGTPPADGGAAGGGTPPADGGAAGGGTPPSGGGQAPSTLAAGGAGATTPAPARAKPALRGQARVRSGRLVVRVSSSSRVTGSVVISAGRRTVTRRLVRGATRVTLRLREGERPRRVTVRYTGDARHRPRTVRITARA